ncbi:VWA domain-containing protein [Acidobacteriota bacterium]
MKRTILHVFLAVLSITILSQEIKHDVIVTLKLIQVYVMDKAGNPITDLNPEDFIVYDNKKLQTLTEFERHILFPPVDIKKSQPETDKADLPSSETDAMNRKFFFFFDLANNNAKGFMKSQRAAQYFIDTQMHPSDEIGVLSFSVLKGLVLHEYFTKDHQAIRDIVDQVGTLGRAGRADNFEALLWRELSGDPDGVLTGEYSVDASTSGSSIWSGSVGARMGRIEHKNITSRMILKLTDLAKALRYIPGNKHILLFSSGIPYTLMYGLSARTGQPEIGMGFDRALADKYEKMLKELSNANTTIFSLNTEALITDMNAPAEVKGELTLIRMSDYTGGKFLGNVQNYEDILGTVQTFTGSYYVLGFYVDESWDGRYHSLKVDVSRPNSKVFAQKGYFNPKNFSKFSNMEKQIHLIDLALSEDPLFQTPVPLPMIATPSTHRRGVFCIADDTGRWRGDRKVYRIKY